LEAISLVGINNTGDKNCNEIKAN